MAACWAPMPLPGSDGCGNCGRQAMACLADVALGVGAGPEVQPVNVSPSSTPAVVIVVVILVVICVSPFDCRRFRIGVGVTSRAVPVRSP